MELEEEKQKTSTLNEQNQQLSEQNQQLQQELASWNDKVTGLVGLLNSEI